MVVKQPLANNPHICELEIEAIHPKTYFWALSICKGNQEEAMELVQDTYLKIYEGKAKFRLGYQSSLKTWVFGVVRITAQENLRKFWKRWLPDGSKRKDEPMAAEHQQQDLENKDRQQQVLSALGLLPEKQKQVMELVTYHDLTIEEASVVMNISIGTARTHYHRAKENLRKTLNRDAP